MSKKGIRAIRMQRIPEEFSRPHIYEQILLTRPQRTPARARLELSSSRTLQGRFTSLLVTCLVTMVVLETIYLVVEESIDAGRDPDEPEHSLVLPGQLLACLNLGVAPELSICALFVLLFSNLLVGQFWLFGFVVEDLIIMSW